MIKWSPVKDGARSTRVDFHVRVARRAATNETLARLNSSIFTRVFIFFFLIKACILGMLIISHYFELITIITHCFCWLHRLYCKEGVVEINRKRVISKTITGKWKKRVMRRRSAHAGVYCLFLCPFSSLLSYSLTHCAHSISLTPAHSLTVFADSRHISCTIQVRLASVTH